MHTPIAAEPNVTGIGACYSIAEVRRKSHASHVVSSRENTLIQASASVDHWPPLLQPHKARY